MDQPVAPEQHKPVTFNSPLEAGIRAVAILAAAYPRSFDLQRLIAFDHLLVHTGDVGGPASLHPPVPLRSAELLVRRKLIERALLLMMTRDLVSREVGLGGIRYTAGENAVPFLAAAQSDYVKALQERVREGVGKPLLAARRVHKGDLQVRVWQAQRDVMNDMVATEDQEQPAGCHQRKARVADRDPGRRTSSGPADIGSAYYIKGIAGVMARANISVGRNLYRIVTGDSPQAAPAGMFWMKTRAGWKETVRQENTGPNGGPIEFKGMSAREIIEGRLARIRERMEEDGHIRGRPDSA
jgi:hypothetical protein